MTIAETVADAKRYGIINGLGVVIPTKVLMPAKKNPTRQSNTKNRIEKYIKLNLCALVLLCRISKNPPNAAIWTANTNTEI